MKKHKIWRIAILILLLGTPAVFLFIDKDTETKPQHVLEQQTKDLLKQDVKSPQQAETPVAVEELPPVVCPNEHPSGPHQHEDDTVHNHSPIVSQKYTGPLTYHAELLETNPVKALRLQAEERGHWSAQWIPPFPPDDLEAAEIARTQYLLIYYESIGDTENPEYKKANSAAWEQSEREAKAIREAYNARVADLMILSWPWFPEADVSPLYEKGWRKSPSDYFPMHISDIK